MTFHSEYGQDSFIANLLPHEGGTFVEFGALDGLLHSNSLYFEREKGWSGLLIEANPSAFASLAQNRPDCALLNAAIYDRSGTVEFEKIDGGLYGWSGIREEIEPQHWSRIFAQVPGWAREIIEVPCMTLEGALNQSDMKDIDFMSIDVEGAEMKVLADFPFERFNINVLSVEDNFGNLRLDDLIRQNGFRFLRKVGPDRVYQRL